MSGKSENKTGRVIRFIHSGDTKLPVRDIKGKGKKEPYIEYGLEKGMNEQGKIIGAENYCYECYPDAIEKVVTNNEDYLFLATYAKGVDNAPDEDMIVGFIKHEGHDQQNPEQHTVWGEIKLYPMKHGIPLSEFGYEPTKNGKYGKYGRVLDSEQIEETLEYFKSLSDVTRECLDKVLEWENKSDIQNSC